MSSEIVRLGPAYAALVVDASTSMDTVAEETRRGIDLQAQMLLERATDRTYLTVVEFSTTARVTFRGEITKFPGINYRPSGDTDLYGGVWLALCELEPEVEDERHWAAPATGLVVVYTDGDDTMRSVDPEAIRVKIAKLRATGRWTFIVAGPDGTVRETCRKLGIPVANAVPFSNRGEDAEAAFEATAAALGGIMDARERGIGAVEDIAGMLPSAGG